MKPGTKVAYQDCLWTVLWVQGDEAGIRSCGGPEAIRVPISELEIWE